MEPSMAKPVAKAKTPPSEHPAPAAPAGLSPEMARWWGEVLKEHKLEPHRLHLLELACRAKDRCAAAGAVIAQDGATYIDRFGAPRTRPEVAIERDSRQAFVRLLLALDLRPPSPFDLLG
jgi:phage terminase small subunit